MLLILFVTRFLGFFSAYSQGDVDLCESFSARGALVDVRRSGDSFTPLHASVLHPDVCKLLIKHRADVNMRAINGVTPLFMASAFGITETCKILLKHGAEWRMTNKCGITSKSIAGTYGRDSIVELFKKFEHDQRSKKTEEEIKALERQLKHMKVKKNIEHLNCEMKVYALQKARLTEVEHLIVTAEGKITNYLNQVEKLKEERETLNLQKEIYQNMQAKKIELEDQLINNSFTEDTSIRVECPICFNVLLPETVIRQCQQGHYCCQICFNKVKKKCPQCPEKKKDFQRARGIEDIIAKLYA